MQHTCIHELQTDAHRDEYLSPLSAYQAGMGVALSVVVDSNDLKLDTP